METLFSCPPLLTLGGQAAVFQSLAEWVLRLKNCLAQQESYYHYALLWAFPSLTWEEGYQAMVCPREQREALKGSELGGLSMFSVVSGIATNTELVTAQSTAKEGFHRLWWLIRESLCKACKCRRAEKNHDDLRGWRVYYFSLNCLDFHSSILFTTKKLGLCSNRMCGLKFTGKAGRCSVVKTAHCS